MLLYATNIAQYEKIMDSATFNWDMFVSRHKYIKTSNNNEKEVVSTFINWDNNSPGLEMSILSRLTAGTNCAKLTARKS